MLAPRSHKSRPTLCLPIEIWIVKLPGSFNFWVGLLWIRELYSFVSTEVRTWLSSFICHNVFDIFCIFGYILQDVYQLNIDVYLSRNVQEFLVSMSLIFRNLCRTVGGGLDTIDDGGFSIPSFANPSSTIYYGTLFSTLIEFVTKVTCFLFLEGTSTNYLSFHNVTAITWALGFSSVSLWRVPLAKCFGH